jgi:hypothetical protein
MKRFFIIFNALLLVLSNAISQEVTKKNSNDVLNDLELSLLKTGNANFECELSCSWSWGGNLGKYRELYDQERWEILAKEMLKISVKEQLAYFFTARSMEGMGYFDAAEKYYKIALNIGKNYKCDRFFNVCAGFSLPSEINSRLSIMQQQLTKTAVDKSQINVINDRNFSGLSTAQESLEISRLRVEADEAKRKQAELEEQLRLANQQNQVVPPAAMTTMANRKALVIGNDTYKSITKLLNAREDAKAIASNLIAVGYKVTLHFDLNEKEMKTALRTFSSQVQGGDEVMFFYAGHGVQLGATNYLLPIDIGGESEAQVKDEAIQLQRVLDDMTEKKAKFTLAMIDACRDNPFKSAGRNIGGRGMAPTMAATGQMVVFSAGTGQQALDRLGNNDKNKNGVFTRTFLKEMQKSGVSIDRIVKNVRNEVAELAKTIGHEQVPAIYDQVLGDFYFKK